MRSVSGAGPVAVLIAAAALWGATTVTVKVAGEGMPAGMITAVELTAATAMLWGMALVRRLRHPAEPWPRPTWPLFIFGLLEPAIAFALINVGVVLSAASTASLILALQSGMVIVIAFAFTGLRPSGIAWTALAIGLLGVALVTGSKPTSSSIVGTVCIFVGMVAASASIVVASRIAQTTGALAMTVWQFTFGWIVLMPATLVLWAMGIVTIHGGIGAKYWAAALLTALIGSVLAFMFYNWSLARVSVGVAGMAINLIPVFGVLFAYIFLGETLQGLAIIGAALVFLGLALFTWDSRRSSGEPEPSAHAAPAPLG